MTSTVERAGGMPGLLAAVLAQRGTVRVPVTGDSMLPTLRPGGHVLVHTADFAEVRPGTVIAFRFGAGVVVHRVLDRDDDALYPAGDNLPLHDLPVHRPDFLGVVPEAGAAPARSARWPSAAADPIRHLWLFGPVPEATVRAATGFGWRVHVRTRLGAGIAPDTRREVLLATGGAPVLGVSAYGVLPAGEVLAAGTPAGTHVLLGCRFGGAACDGGGRLLAPETASVHVRLGGPAEHLELAQAVAAFLDLAAPHRHGGRATAARAPR